jgi:hypothetical protein
MDKLSALKHGPIQLRMSVCQIKGHSKQKDNVRKAGETRNVMVFAWRLKDPRLLKGKLNRKVYGK